MANSSVFEGTPEQLKVLARSLKAKFSRPAYALFIDPNLPLYPVSSRIGGLPYIYKGFEYPHATGHGLVAPVPLRFICQINLDELAKVRKIGFSEQVFNKFNSTWGWLPTTGLLQFYALCDDAYGATYRSFNCVKYIPRIPPSDLKLTMDELLQRIEQAHLRLEFISNLVEDQWPTNWPIQNQIGLAFKAIVSLPGMGDHKFFMDCMRQVLQAEFEISLPVCLDDFYIDEESSLNSPFINPNERMFKLLVEQNFKDTLRWAKGINFHKIKRCVGQLLGYPDFKTGNPIASWQPNSNTYVFEEFGDIRRFNLPLLSLEQGDTRKVVNGKVTPDFDMNWGDGRIATFFIQGADLARAKFDDVFFMWS